MARTYKRDSKGRFAGGGGSGGGGGNSKGSSKPASKPRKTAAAKKPSIEKRLQRSWMRRRDLETSVSNRNWGGGAINAGTSGSRGQARVENQRRRARQQSAAIANLVAKLKPSGQAKANKLRQAYGI